MYCVLYIIYLIWYMIYYMLYVICYTSYIIYFTHFTLYIYIGYNIYIYTNTHIYIYTFILYTCTQTRNNIQYTSRFGHFLKQDVPPEGPVYELHLPDGTDAGGVKGGRCVKGWGIVIMWVKQCHQPPILGWFIPTIYGDLRDGLLLFYPYDP